MAKKKIKEQETKLELELVTDEVTEETETKVTEEAEVTEEATDEGKVTEEAEVEATPEPPKSGKVEYWARQVMINGTVVSGKVKAADKKAFLAACKANGADIHYGNWFKDTNWEDRVYKKAKLNKK